MITYRWLCAAALRAALKDATRFTIEVERAALPGGRAKVEKALEPEAATPTADEGSLPGDPSYTPLQRAATRKAIKDGQAEFERLLIEASQRGAQDINAIEKIGEEVSKRTQERALRILNPQQQARFREEMRRAEAEEPAAPPK